MLKYYSYYNVGGYKDMFLGDSTMKDTETYYLPLLSIWKKKTAAGDAEAEAKVKLTESLPKIQLLSTKENFGLPEEATPMFSHGGYKVMYTLNAKGESIFAIRDVESDSKDESGRTIPFLLVIVGTTETDAKTLEKVSAYACSHMESFSNELADLFYYDAERQLRHRPSDRLHPSRHRTPARMPPPSAGHRRGAESNPRRPREIGWNASPFPPIPFIINLAIPPP